MKTLVQLGLILSALLASINSHANTHTPSPATRQTITPQTSELAARAPREGVSAPHSFTQNETLTLNGLSTFVECERQGSLGIGCPRVRPDEKPIKFVLKFDSHNLEGLDVYKSEMDFKKFRASKNELTMKVALWKFHNPKTQDQSYRIIVTFWGNDYFNASRADFNALSDFSKVSLEGNYYFDNEKIFYPTLKLSTEGLK